MMLTRCPGCTTTFRVTSEQLKVRQGRVRCGQCQQVFNAIEHLTDVRADTPAAKTMPSDDTVVIELSPVSEIKADTFEATSESASALTPVTPLIHIEASESAESTELIEHVEPREQSEAPEEHAATPPSEHVRHSDDTPLLQPSPLSGEYALPKDSEDKAPRWPWFTAALLTLLMLVAQGLVAFRVDLAAKHPGLQPLLATLCQVAHCTVDLPSNPDLVSIEVSDLHPGRKSGLELTATLRNHAPYAQAWPNLELTLTDATDKPIVRKVLTPTQYLPATQSLAQGFPAGNDVALQLAFDPGTLPADGYRLYLFYP